MNDPKTLQFRPHGSAEAVEEEPVYEVDASYDGGQETALAQVEAPVTRTATARKPRPRPAAATNPTRSGDGVRTPRSAQETQDLGEAKKILDKQAKRGKHAAKQKDAGEEPAPRTRAEKKPVEEPSAAAEPRATRVRARKTVVAGEPAETAASAPSSSAASAKDDGAVTAKASRSTRRGQAYTPKKSVDVGAAVGWVRGKFSGGDRQGKADKPKTPLRDKGWPRVVAVIVVALAVVGVMMYTPLKNLYTAHREQERLNAQLEVLNSNNDDLKDRINELQTKEGIMDEARRHGYVVDGETAVEVDGVDDGEKDGTAAVAPDTLGTSVPETEDPWYIQALDTIFGYSAS